MSGEMNRGEDMKDGFMERKMQMMKMQEDRLNAMGDKELRAFIKGYMMAEQMVFKHMSSMGGACQSGSCENCKCGEKECNCGKEE